MADDDALTAARAELDQARAAVDEQRPVAEQAQQAYAAVSETRRSAIDGFKQQLIELAPANEAASAELERREGAVRAAEAKVADLEAGGSGEAPPAQEVG